MSSLAPPLAPPQAGFEHCATWSDTKQGQASGDGNHCPPTRAACWHRNPLTTRMPTSAGAPASVTSETIAVGPANEQMRAPTLVTTQKRPLAARRILKTTPHDAKGTADSSSDSSSTSDGCYERMSIDSPQISPPRTPSRRRSGTARMTSFKTLTPTHTVRRKG